MSKKRTNADIHEKIATYGLKYWQVAQSAGISPSNFSVWLRCELDGERKKRIEDAINRLVKEEG